MDGLTYEFYRAVWDVIGKCFVEVLQVQLERLNLIESDKMGATKLASKVDGVPGAGVNTHTWMVSRCVHLDGQQVCAPGWSAGAHQLA